MKLGVSVPPDNMSTNWRKMGQLQTQGQLLVLMSEREDRTVRTQLPSRARVLDVEGHALYLTPTDPVAMGGGGG